MGEGLPRRGVPNPHMGSSFPWRGIQIATGRPWDHKLFMGERNRLKKLFRREKISSSFIDQPYRSDRCEKLV
jgi:hypothetical protein